MEREEEEGMEQSREGGEERGKGRCGRMCGE